MNNARLCICQDGKEYGHMFTRQYSFVMHLKEKWLSSMKKFYLSSEWNLLPLRYSDGVKQQTSPWYSCTK